MKQFFHNAIFLLSLLSSCSSIYCQWNADKNVNNPVVVAANRQEFHAMCSDGAGGAVIAWYDARANQFLYDVFVQRINDQGQPMWPVNGIPMGATKSQAIATN